MVAYYLVLLLMAVWAGWLAQDWAVRTRHSDAATAARISATWPAGKRQFELRDRIIEAQEQERRAIATRIVVQGCLGLAALHLLSLGLKGRAEE